MQTFLDPRVCFQYCDNHRMQHQTQNAFGASHLDDNGLPSLSYLVRRSLRVLHRDLKSLKMCSSKELHCPKVVLKSHVVCLTLRCVCDVRMVERHWHTCTHLFIALSTLCSCRAAP
jgi:hypothetical protein